MKKYFSSVIGNILEHYDKALYGFLVPILAPLFFPASDPVFSLLYAYCLFPLGLLRIFCNGILFSYETAAPSYSSHDEYRTKELFSKQCFEAF
jgi:hypothetical protein